MMIDPQVMPTTPTEWLIAIGGSLRAINLRLDELVGQSKEHDHRLSELERWRLTVETIEKERAKIATQHRWLTTAIAAIISTAASVGTVLVGLANGWAQNVAGRHP